MPRKEPKPIIVDKGSYKLLIEIYGPEEAHNMEIMKRIKQEEEIEKDVKT